MCVAPVILIGDFNIHYKKSDKSGKICSLCDFYNMVATCTGSITYTRKYPRYCAIT